LREVQDEAATTITAKPARIAVWIGVGFWNLL
jgi:hypothetical protein